MVYESSEEKKKEIVEFLEDKVENGNLLDLNLEDVKNKFSDDYHDEDKIEDIIDDLKDDDVLKSKNAKLDVLVPKKYEEKVSRDWGEIFKPKTGQVMWLGFFIFAGLLSWDPFFAWIKDASSFTADSQAFLKATLWGLIGTWLSGIMGFGLYHRIEEHRPKVRDYTYLIAPTVIFPLAAIAVMLYFNSSISWISDSIPSILGVIFTAAGAGIALGIYLHKQENAEAEQK